MGRTLQAAEDTLWDSPASIWPSAFSDLELWTTYMLHNTPLIVVKRLPADFLVLVDAAANGWGYCAVDLRSDAIFCHGEPWSDDFIGRHGSDKLRRSAFTEPHGLFFSKQHLLRCIGDDGPPRSFKIGSDSVTAIATFRRGYASRSYDLNLVASLDRSSVDIARHQWSDAHVPGVSNTVADALSRGNSVSREELLGLGYGLRRLLGVIPVATSGGGSVGPSAISI
jgi:hypothetical protein